MNNEIWTPSQTRLVFSEKADKKGIMMYGVMMPSNEISRNNVMYDWKSVHENHSNLISKPVMYNHEIDGMGAVSIGHYTDSQIMTVMEIMGHPKYKILAKEIERLNYPASKELWVYEADLDPSEEKYINKIRRGDLRHVSIQLKAANTEEKFDGDNNYYTYAYVGDIIEGSVVPTPGFLQTCAVLAEKYGGNKMSNNKESIEIDGKFYKEVEMTHEEKLFLNNKKEIKTLKEEIKALKENAEDNKMSNEDKKLEENQDAPEPKIEENILPNQEIDAETKKDHDPEKPVTVTAPVKKDHTDANMSKEAAEEDETTKKEEVDEEDGQTEAVEDEVKKEAEGDEEVKKESEDEEPEAEDNEDLNNMEKIVSILETMKENLDDLNKKVEELEDSEEVKKEAEDEEDSSIKECLSLGRISMKESTSNNSNKKEFSNAVKSILRS